MYKYLTILWLAVGLSAKAWEVHILNGETNSVAIGNIIIQPGAVKVANDAAFRTQWNMGTSYPPIDEKTDVAAVFSGGSVTTEVKQSDTSLWTAFWAGFSTVFVIGFVSVVGARGVRKIIGGGGFNE